MLQECSLEQPSVSQEYLRQFTWQGKTSSLSIDESTLCLRNSSDADSKAMEIPSCHILSASPVEPSKKESKWSLRIDYIKSTGEKSLKKSTTSLHGSKENCESGASDINTLVQSLPNRKKSLLIIVNPVSGRKKGLKTYHKILPLFELANIKTEMIVTKEKGHATELLKQRDLGDIDGIVLVGGDGTYYEVLNGLLFRAQVEAKYDLDCPGCDWMPTPLPVGLIPCGSGNGIAKSLVSLDPVTATLAVIIGKTCKMTTYTVHQNSGKFLTFGGLLIGYGYFSDVIYKAENNRRTLGIFRYPVYMLWGLFNIRRFKIDIEYEVSKEDFPESSEDGASAGQKRGEDFSMIKDGDFSVKDEDGCLTEQKDGKDSASDVNVGSKPENIGVTSRNKEPVRRKVIAEINRYNDGESNLEVKGDEFMSSEGECDAEDQNTNLSADDNDAVQSGGNSPNGSATDGSQPGNIPKEPVAIGEVDVAECTKDAAAVSEWKYLTGSYISFGTFLHFFERDPHRAAAVEMILCHTFGDLKTMFLKFLDSNKDTVGTTFRTKRMLLELPAVDGNNEMELALNCDGDYIILETPIALQICTQVGLINVFCC